MERRCLHINSITKIEKKKGKIFLTGEVTQSGVSDKFAMLVPIYIDFGRGWTYLGSATIIGNKSISFKDVPLPAKPKKVAIAAMQDVLAEKIINKKTIKI